MEAPIRHIFDLHCDTLTVLAKRNVDLTDDKLHVCIDRLPKNYRLAQAMAIYMPDSLRGESAELYFENVHQLFCAQMEKFRDRMSPVYDFSAIDDILSQKQFAMMLTIEGGSALASKLENVERFYNMGVRAMNLTWNAENEICGGADCHDTGFSDFGRRVVSEMERVGMVVDVSHLSDVGFYQLLDFASRPFIASHSNSRSLCQHRRNLTDEMFMSIRDIGGIVGFLYYDVFVKDGGGATMDDIIRHVHHFLEIGGEKTLALGTDHDGARQPEYIVGLDKFEYLRERLLGSGIPEEISDDILYRNARNFFKSYSKNK